MPYLSDLINDHKAIRNESKEWKIQINVRVNFISSKDTGETRTIFVWSDNKEIRSGNETDDIIKGLLQSFLNNYQEEEIILRKGSDFHFHLNFISSKDTGETCSIFVWSDNKEIRSSNEIDDIIKGLLQSFLNNYQEEEIILRKGSDFVFESVDLLSYHVHKTSLKRGKSYIKSLNG